MRTDFVKQIHSYYTTLKLAPENQPQEKFSGLLAPKKMMGRETGKADPRYESLIKAMRITQKIQSKRDEINGRT